MNKTERAYSHAAGFISFVLVANCIFSSFRLVPEVGIQAPFLDSDRARSQPRPSSFISFKGFSKPSHSVFCGYVFRNYVVFSSLRKISVLIKAAAKCSANSASYSSTDEALSLPCLTAGSALA